MKPGDWYKQFGSKEKQHDVYEIYFHILEASDEKILLDEYGYYTHFRRLIKRNNKPIAYETKEWLEENIKNNVYEVERGHLPFYLNI